MDRVSSIDFTVATSDLSEATVYYPTTLSFTQENWNVSHAVYIVGEWDDMDDGAIAYNVTFKIDVNDGVDYYQYKSNRWQGDDVVQGRGRGDPPVDEPRLVRVRLDGRQLGYGR